MSDLGIADWLDMMPLIVKVNAFETSGSYGGFAYSTVTQSYRARVDYKTNYIRGAHGELIATKGVIWLATGNPIGSKDKITLPDGTEPPVLLISRVTDQDGSGLYTRIDFG